MKKGAEKRLVGGISLCQPPLSANPFSKLLIITKYYTDTFQFFGITSVRISVRRVEVRCRMSIELLGN